MSGGVSVLCWLAAPVAMFYGNFQNLVIRSKSVIKSSSIISSQICVMSDQLLFKFNLIIYNLFLRDPIGNKSVGFYGLSRLTVSFLFLVIIFV